MIKQIEPIAVIRTQFSSKFGIPRQSGLADTAATVIFEPKYRVPEALRGIEEYSYLWLIWGFHKAEREKWQPTVRPPRLGGNVRMGVFATRSPFRPNALGLSSVQLIKKEQTEAYGTVLYVSGADLLDNTPIYDIKPYLAFTDSHPEAKEGFARAVKDECLRVVFLAGEQIPDERQKKVLIQLLSQDPRPHYQADKNREYAFEFDDLRLTFTADEQCVYVTSVEKLPRL